jgi:hypothetical protein
MQRKTRWGALLSLGALCVAVSSSAQSLGTTARQLSPGSLKFLVYYQGTNEQKLTFSPRGTAGCIGAGAFTPAFGCNEGGEVTAQGFGGAMIGKVVYQPWDSLQYYAFGGAGKYDLKLPAQRLTGDTPGTIFGAGVKAVVMPDTIVQPGIAIEASASNSRYAFNRISPGAPAVSNQINDLLVLWQYQVAVEISHLFELQGAKVEPYGGVKWSRIQADLNDRQAGNHTGGKQEDAMPFVGLRVPVYDHEGIFIEGAFNQGEQIAGGLEVRFDGNKK